MARHFSKMAVVMLWSFWGMAMLWRLVARAVLSWISSSRQMRLRISRLSILPEMLPKMARISSSAWTLGLLLFCWTRLKMFMGLLINMKQVQMSQIGRVGWCCLPLQQRLQEIMPRRREKRTDTENSDDFEEEHKKDKIVHFGTVRFNRMLAPDQIDGDDSSRFSILAWSNTLQAQRLLPWVERKLLFRRALSCLPYSYKIWHMYLEEFVDYCSSRSLQSKEWAELNTTFEEALTKLPKMPRIWLMFSEALQKQELVSRAREVYNWSFRNLPLTQHEKIWHKFTAWAMRLDNYSTALRIVPRYLKLNPDFKETYAEYLIEKGLYDRGASVIKAILDDEGYHSKAGKDQKNFYFDLMELIAQHPDKIKCVDPYTVIRNALTLYPEDEGKIWVKISDFFIRLGEFDRAREILQEAIEAVNNAKDFGVIFSAYVKFQKEMITALANEEIRSQYEVIEEDNVDFEIETRLGRLQKLVDRQPYLLHNIAIKKNPNQVQPWLGLVNLHISAGNIEKGLEVIERAINTIVPDQAEGKLSDVWIEYSRILQNQKEFRRCNEVLFQATQVNFKMNDDSFSIWRRWTELLIEQRFYDDALRVVKQVLFKRRNENDPKMKSTEETLKNHSSLWQLYIDLEINLGNFDTIKIAYERCKEHRSLTPIMLLNYTNFLWEAAYFQETFRVFEFALSNFKWPSLHQIWLAYINKFITRHADSAAGVERGRSMFERLLKEVPKEHAGVFYFIYAEFEEKYGLYSHAVEIYDRMVRAVPVSQRFQAYTIFITKIAKLLGVTKSRKVFESAMQNLGEKDVLIIGRKYAELQTNLGEIERARAVFGHISQFTDPRDDNENLWNEWEKFEVQYGDKESYKEYLRIKRSVEAKFAMLPPDLDKIEANIKKGLA